MAHIHLRGLTENPFGQHDCFMRYGSVNKL